jgi:hypothetical protein
VTEKRAASPFSLTINLAIGWIPGAAESKTSGKLLYFGAKYGDDAHRVARYGLGFTTHVASGTLGDAA